LNTAVSRINDGVSRAGDAARAAHPIEGLFRPKR
jgi:hypothetical protein